MAHHGHPNGGGQTGFRLLIHAGQFQVGHLNEPGGGVISRHIPLPEVGGRGGNAVFQHGVIAGSHGREGITGPIGHRPQHHGLSARRCGGTQEDIPQLSVGSVVQGHGGPRLAHIHPGTLPGGGPAGAIDLGGRLHIDTVAVGGHQIGGLRPGHIHHPAGAALLGHKGHQLSVAVQQQLAFLPHDGAVKGPVGLIGVPRGLHRSGTVISGGVHVQNQGVFHLTAPLAHQIALVGTLGLGKIQVVEQNGRLSPADDIAAGKGQPLGQSAGGAQRQISVIPGAPHGHIGLAVPQHPAEDGHRLPIGDGPVGLEGAVPHPGHQRGAVLPAQPDGGGKIDVTRGPEGGAHVQIDGAAPLGRLFIGPVQCPHRHGAELGPAQGAGGVISPAGHTVHHPHQLQKLGSLGHLGHPSQIREGGGCGKGPGQGPRQHGHGQYRGKETLHAHW